MPNFSGVWNLKDQVQAIAAGRWTGIPLYSLYGWGRGDNGQLDNNSRPSSQSSPLRIGTLTGWSQLSAGGNSSFSIRTDGTLWGWGNNASGQLGLGNVVSRSSPVQVGALTNWSMVSTGSNQAAAIKTDGTLWMWGNNANGQLGDGTVIPRSSPVQVGALTNWSTVSSATPNAGQHTLAVKNDGTLWAWGKNQGGQLGRNYGTSFSSPVQVGALTNWSKVSAGQYSSFAVKTDFTLWVWGLNYAGQLGLGNAIYSFASPVQVGSLTDWSQVIGATVSTVAVKTNGTLWAWGSNSVGQLGQNDIVNRSSPVQIGALTTWTQIAVGTNASIAKKTDGTLWGVGQNASGQLGDGTTINRSSPVQVGALTNWQNISMGESHVLSNFLQETTN
jgi:alpha-tubulin suppressor-like RCC1 family protein